ncbi:MAG: amino acid adenylation domain-containing protein [Acidimicrobiales bacterium]
MQRALWTSQRLHPGAPVQNMAILTHIDGAVDPDRLAEAFEQVVAASDVLRSRIVDAGGTPLVRLDAEPQPRQVVDLDRTEAEAWARRRVATPVDLSVRGYDSVVLRHGDGTVSWYLDLHHAITDATSSALVFEATADAYHGRPPRLEPYYRRVAERDGDPARSRRADRANAHWQQRTAPPAPGRLYQPLTHPTPEATRLDLPLTPPLVAAIAERLDGTYRMLSPDLGWTALLATVTAAYVHHTAGAESFTIGLPVHNRSDATTRRLVGPLMEVFPVDVTVDPGATYRLLHRTVSRAVLATLAHAVPGTAPAADHAAVVNVIGRAGLGSFGPVPATTRWIHSGAIDSSHLLRVQLTAYDAETGDGGPQLALDLNRGGVGDDHLARAPGHFLTALYALVTDPDRPVADSLVDETERRQLERWGAGPAVEEPAPDLADQLRLGLADRTAISLRHGDRTWTGSALWAEVGRCAATLRQRGVGPGVRVGVELPRSAEAVVAILAVLVAGGSFVPLDVSQPAGRRRRLAERAGCAITLSGLADVELAGGASDPTGGVPSDGTPDDGDPTGGEPSDGDPTGGEPSDGADGPAPSAGADPDDEAYLLFTSGSTGEPKGVPIRRGGIARYIRFATEHYLDRHRLPGSNRGPDAHPDPDAASSDLVVPLFSSLGFDLTLTSLFLPLVAGGELVVVDGDGPTALARVAATTELTWCKATPSHLELLLRLLAPGHRLRTLVVGGEAFGAGLARRLLEAVPGLEMFNEYGPTEAVVGCMIHRVEPAHPGDGPEVPIGGPAPGVTLRIVGPGLGDVPIGAAGELLIAGDGLTSGYLDPEHDEGRFVVVDGRRFYRSGDLVRLVDPDTAVYLGRVDEQVKVGGIRLEPTEVEEALRAHPAIEAAAVRLWRPSLRPPDRRCVRCGLPSNVPGVDYDDEGVCATCHEYDRIAPQARAWFRTEADLVAERDEARRRRTGPYDCLHLLSGGKDSTYALYRLVELGFEPYVLTLDNGFISEQAKDNVRRSVADLGLDHEFATTDAMDAIFRDSLQRHANVCHGCYKTIYTLATNRAVELGIPLIVTGLSRGQLFETRLIPQQFAPGRFDPDAIDRAVLEARKTYHRLDDGPNRLLDTSVFATDDVFDQVRYLDLYRYVDVELDELLAYLDANAPWVRPTDTGRSTNCLINAAGIHTHQRERGYHNYAIPYAWDVRLGHKTRQEAIDELDDRLDDDEVGRLLDAVGYRVDPPETLTAWLQPRPGQAVPTPAALRAFLATTLPAHAIPRAFVAVAALPLNANGKLDADARPPPQRTHRASAGILVEATTEREAQVVAVWERILGLEPIGVDDDFFALGGDSLAALEMIVALAEAAGTDLPEALAFLETTPRTLAAAIDLAADGATGRRPGGPDGPTPPSAPTPWTADDPPPLSVGERSILFEQGRRPDSVMYNVGRLHRVDGSVDGDRFAAALRTVAGHHVPLAWTYGAPRRPLTAEEAVTVEVIADPVAPEALDAVLEPRHRLPFDLDRGPLLRALVQPLTDGTTAVLLVCHHVSGDAGGFELLWSAVDAVLSGAEVAVPPTDYATFTRWQHDIEGDGPWPVDQGPDPGAPAALALAPPPVPGADGFASRVATIAPGELRATAGATGFAVATAALAATLRRYGDGDRVELGMLASTRTHPAARALVGYFLNTLPVRVPVAGDDTLAAVVSRASAAVAANLAHRAVPYARIVADRRLAGRPAPATDILLAYDELLPASLEGRAVESRALSNGTAVTDATFFVEVRPDRIDLSVEHRGTVLDRETAHRLLADLDAMLTATVRTPGATVAAVDLAGGLPSILAGPPLDPPPSLLPAIVAHTVGRGDEPAVECDGDTLTWAELGRRSTEVAERLTALGIGPGDRVTVRVPRSCDLVVAVIGALRSGAAYVPVDPAYPADRIALLERAAEAAATITSDDGGAPRDDGATGSGLTVRPTGLRPRGRSVVGTAPPSEDAAYVIFTSGSTGRPRGVPVSHGRLAASTAARAEVYGTTPERFLLLSSAAFDSSVVGLFWTLATGGTIVLPTDAQSHDPHALVDLLDRSRITHVLAVPSLYQALVERGRQRGHWPHQVIVAGEACPRSLVEAHHRLRPASRLTNEYGPTEATVWATAHHCGPGRGPVPIGVPVPGAWVAVVDPDGRPVPLGVEGELVIGGLGVVAGYLDDPEATARRFAGTGDDRRFRTGDRAVVTDGTVWFRGRLDDQLNVGGVRVEPGDIERVLSSVPGVGAALAVDQDPRTVDELLAAVDGEAARSALAAAATATDPVTALADALRVNAPDATLLVAHLERAADAEVDLDAVRAAVTERLPTALRPTIYAVHDRLPRTPNGKLDRAAARRLPAGRAVTDRDAADRDAVAGTPSGGNDGTVTAVAELFAAVLRVDRVGPERSFFDLGGHSLLALDLLDRVRDRFGVDLTVSTLYDDPTPAGVARRLGATAAGGAQYRYLVPVQPRGSLPPIFGIHVLGVNSVFYRPLAARLGADQPLFGLGQPTLDLDTTAPTDVAEVAARYADELERCAPTGPVVLAAVSLGGIVAFELAHQLTARGRDVALLALFDAAGPDASTHAPTGRRRAELHLRAVRERPVDYVVDRARNVGLRLGRRREILALAARRALSLPVADELRIRRFVEDNWRSQLAYRYRPYGGRVVVFKAGDDQFTADLVERGMGWAGAVAGPLDVEVVPGGHLTMLAEPHVEVLAARLEAAVAAAVGRNAVGAEGPIDRSTVEGELRTAVHQGRLAGAVDRWLRRVDELEPDAAALVRAADATTRTLARRSDEAAEEAVAALGAAGLLARSAPRADRLQRVAALVTLADAGPGDMARATDVLAGLGYRPQGTAADGVLVRADDDTTRLRLVVDGDHDDPSPAGAGGPDDPEARGAGGLGVFLGTPCDLIADLLAVAAVGPDDVVVDLGCGDGRVLIEAARRYGCRARGVERDPALVARSVTAAEQAGLHDRIEVIEADLSDESTLSAALDGATVVFAFLPAPVTAELVATVVGLLPPGGRFLAHEQVAASWPVRPDERRLVLGAGVTVATLWRSRS